MNDEKVIFWHDPALPASRAALALVSDLGLEVDVVPILERPPSADDIGAALRMLEMSPRRLVDRRAPEYAALGLDGEAVTDAHLVAAMAAHPSLIQRPVVMLAGKAVLARPPERALALFHPRRDEIPLDGLPHGLAALLDRRG